MKKIVLWGTALCLVLSLSWIVWNMRIDGRFERYGGEASYLKVGFDHPSGWRTKIEQGKIEFFTQVIILGPRNPANTFSAGFIVRKTPLGGGNPINLEELKKKRIDHLFGHLKILSESSVTVDRVPGKDMTVTFTSAPVRTAGIPFRPTNVKSRMVFVEKDSAVFEIIYSAESGQFDKHLPAFQHLLKSFRFYY